MANDNRSKLQAIGYTSKTLSETLYLRAPLVTISLHEITLFKLLSKKANAPRQNIKPDGERAVLLRDDCDFRPDGPIFLLLIIIIIIIIITFISD